MASWAWTADGASVLHRPCGSCRKLLPLHSRNTAAADEHASIREWILYHHMLGVGMFYIYDDYSFPPLEAVLGDLMQAGLVKYRFLLPGEKLEKGGNLEHDSVFNTCLHQYGGRHTFMGESCKCTCVPPACPSRIRHVHWAGLPQHTLCLLRMRQRPEPSSRLVQGDLDECCSSGSAVCTPRPAAMFWVLRCHSQVASPCPKRASTRAQGTCQAHGGKQQYPPQQYTPTSNSCGVQLAAGCWVAPLPTRPAAATIS